MALDPIIKQHWIEVQKKYDYPVTAIGKKIEPTDKKALNIWKQEGIMPEMTVDIPENETDTPGIEKNETNPPVIMNIDNDEATSHAWKPKEPESLENILQKVSRWPKIFIPFLAQNIGWFISGFLFIAGSIFLVTYTEGFKRTLIINAILSGYTLLLIGGAYMMKQRRPELSATAGVLITLAMLLIPLSIAASVRLISTGGSVTPAIGIFMALVNLLIFYWAAQLGSGIMDRSLQGMHPRIFIALNAVQLTIPLLFQFPGWQLLAFLHLSLMCVLGYGLVLFINDWSKNIWLDRRKLAYYAAGTLIYAAVISFVHLTWQYKNPLPDGYFSPFLMVLCGFLFFADAKFKEWTRRYTFLSHLNFAIYGLSVLALALASHTSEVRLLTLILGTGVYAVVVRHYLTLVPLYLLLVCLGWLYSLMILCHIPSSFHFLASLPGLVGILGIHWWALKRKAEKLAMMCLRVTIILGACAAIWSLFNAGQSVISVTTCLIITGFLYYALRYLPVQYIKALCLNPASIEQKVAQGSDLRNTYWFYTVLSATVLTLAYMPVFFKSGIRQFISGLLVLAVLWTWHGLKLYSRMTENTAPRVSVLLNSALLNTFSALALSLVAELPLQTNLLHFVLITAAGLFAWQSIVLRVRCLFYFALAAGGAGTALIKHTYFPGPSAGLIEILSALALWTVLWRSERIQKMKPENKNHFPLPTSHFSLLTFSTSHFSLAKMLSLPLKQTMIVLWGLAIWLLIFVSSHNPTLLWVLSAVLSTLTTMLLCAYFRLLFLWALPLLMGLGAMGGLLSYLNVLNIMSMSFASALYAVAAWLFVRWVGAKTFTQRLTGLLLLNRGHENGLVEQKTFQTAYIIILTGMAVAVGNLLTAHPVLVLNTLLAGIFFFWLSGQYYQKQLNSYMVLVAVTAVFFVLHSRVLEITGLTSLLTDARTGLSAAFIGLCMGVAAWILDQLAHKEETESLPHSLYSIPLRITGAVLALAASGQQMLLILGNMPPGISPINVPVLCLASIGLLLSNHKLQVIPFNLIGVLLVSLTLLWSEGFLVHGGKPLAFWPVYGDQWLTIALLTLGLAVMAGYIDGFIRWRLHYAQPLRFVSVLGFICIMLETLPVFGAVINAGNVIKPYEPWLLLIQGLTLFPLLQPLSKPASLRGVGILIFLTGFTASILSLTGFLKWNGITLLLVASVLWGASNFVLPGFNKRWPRWAVAGETWPWFGLILISLIRPLAIRDNSLFLESSYWLCIAVYLFLMLRNFALYGIYWLASGLLTGAGLLFVGKQAWDSESYGFFIIGSLVLANLLMLAVPMLRRYGSALAERMKWKERKPETPFIFWPSLISISVLFLQILFVIFNIILNFNISDQVLVFISAILTGTFIHQFQLHRTIVNAHCLILSVFNIALTGCSVFPSVFFHLPILLALASGTLFIVHTLSESGQDKENSPIHTALEAWLMLSPWFALSALLITPVASLYETLLTLTLLTGIIAGMGCRFRQSWMILAARLLGLVLLHTWPLVFLPPGKTKGQVILYVWPVLCAQFERLQILFPWYALQLSVVVWVMASLRQRLANYLKEHPLRTLFENLALETSLAVGIWITHFFVFISKLDPMPPENALIQGIPALLAACLMILPAIRRMIASDNIWWFYGTAAMTGLAGIYLRLLCKGLAPLCLWDTTALMAAAYGLFMLRLLPVSEMISVQLYRMSLLLPVFALLTTPLHSASSSAAAVLMAAGALYLSMRYTTGRSLPLYLCVLTINAAVYLWIPAWSKQCNLMQLYIVPAALSVLVLLQLHQDELKRSVLNNTRLAVLSVLYANAALDVFLRPELWVFGLAVFLSLAGVVAGIALRIRAFLYSGVVFLVINVVGQLIHHYPEQGLGKGILLMVSGALIMAGMIWFSIKREAILKHIRIFRADMECWA
ncbi:MAG: hypothetical protein GY749_13660 [Desulfobacteraceae bacterium]|nr:hypothetical protein [Desulfobacteraceae bacterium]